MKYSYLWEFVVEPECVPSFVEAYGPEGPWARLFRRSPAYLGTDLLRDREDPRRYLTIDNWQSKDGYRAFMNDFREDYESLDRSLSGLASEERLVGHFDVWAETL